MHAPAVGPAEICEHAGRQLHEIELEVGEVWRNSALGYNIRRDMMAIASDTITDLFGESQALGDVVDEAATVSLEKRKIAYVAHC
jgi:hypothetical protein